MESYLFSIAAHKLTDHLRREGRRPAMPLSAGDSSSGDWNLPGRDRPASSIMRSGERRELEAVALAAAMREQIDRWRSRGEWWKIHCAELLFVRGWANKDVAVKLKHLASSKWPIRNSISWPASARCWSDRNFRPRCFRNFMKMMNDERIHSEYKKSFAFIVHHSSFALQSFAI